jgi:predicted amidohydrolase YtcJ
MNPRTALALLVALASAAPLRAETVAGGATLILSGGRIWTGDTAKPWAEAVAVKDDRILAVGSASEIAPLRGPGTRWIELAGRFAAPGFIDSHTHFERAGALLLGVNLLDVADEAGLVRRVEEARDRLPEGAWLVGGDWGAYALDSPFKPHRSMIDRITRGNPALLAKWDRSLYLANRAALVAAGAGCHWPGVECDAGGEPTGRLTAEAAERVRAVIPEKPLPQRLAESRAALLQLAGFGVTTIHDITSAEQLAVYQELRRRGELTVRVYARPTLDRWEHLAALGIRHGFGDAWIKIGGLKGFVDGIMGNSSARFYEPYRTTGERGSWRPMMEPAGNMEKLLLGADAAGHWPQVHAIGDEAIDTLLDLYEKTIAANGARERRFRVIHAQVLRGPETAARIARLGLIAEVQPFHAIDDIRWMEPRIGARARWAYAFKTLQDAGVRLCFGSDWPGTNASWYPADPVLGIYAAVTRQTVDGTPAGGWFPQERIDLETALRAYTVNNAWAAGEEDLKGRLAPGLLADIAVLDRDPFAVPPEELKEVKTVLTVVGGKIVYQAGGG